MISENLTIPYPSFQPEAEVQAEIWYLLRLSGYDARMEVKAESDKFISDNGPYGQRRSHNSLDIVVFRDEAPLLVIEVKRDGKRGESGDKNHQTMRYAGLYNLPVFMAFGPEEILYTVERVNAFFS